MPRWVGAIAGIPALAILTVYPPPVGREGQPRSERRTRLQLTEFLGPQGLPCYARNHDVYDETADSGVKALHSVAAQSRGFNATQ